MNCPPGSLGPCVVQLELCSGTCEGEANPVPNTPCERGGTCRGKECIPPVGGAGGQGGAGGAGGTGGS